jgi:regulator of replication initiation timing
MSLIDEIKSIAGVIQKVDNIELYRKILDLQAEALELIEQNSSLRAENIRLKEINKIQSNLVFKGNKYWLKKEESKMEGPYCSKCWDSNNKLLRMHDLDDYFHCPECKTIVYKECAEIYSSGAEGYIEW